MPTTINLQVLDDSCIDSYQPTVNYGSSPVLLVGKLIDGVVYRSLLNFDLNSIPSGASIKSAVLTLYLNLDYSGASAAAQVTPYAVANSWNGTTVTWNNQPAINNAITGSTTNATVLGIYRWDVFNIVNAWVSGNLTNNGLELKTTEIIEIEGKSFNSSNAISQKPVLTIEYNSAPNATDIISSVHTKETGHEDVITADSYQSTIGREISQNTLVSFAVKNSSANCAEVGIEGSLDGVNYSQEITSKAFPKTTEVLLEPLYYAAYRRVIYKSSSPGMPALLSIDYQAKSL